MECRFCNIQKEHSERLLYEKRHVFAILSDPRLMEGHVLVIPKRHVEKLSELSGGEREELMDEVIRVEEKILLEFPGADVVQNYRPFISENALKVNHLHVHIRPRSLNDELYEKVQITEKGVFKPLPDGEMEKYKNLFAG